MPAADVGGLAGWVVDVIESIGAIGVALLVMLENVFPPIPSEVVLAFAGFSAARGVLNPFTAWAAATAGSLAGAYLLYAVGARLGYDRLHELAGRRWFVLFNQTDLGRGERFFRDHGGKVVLLARVMPGAALGGVDPGRHDPHAARPLHRAHRRRQRRAGTPAWCTPATASASAGSRVGQYVSPVTQVLLVASPSTSSCGWAAPSERHARRGAEAGR